MCHASSTHFPGWVLAMGLTYHLAFKTLLIKGAANQFSALSINVFPVAEDYVFVQLNTAG